VPRPATVCLPRSRRWKERLQAAGRLIRAGADRSSVHPTTYKHAGESAALPICRSQADALGLRRRGASGPGRPKLQVIEGRTNRRGNLVRLMISAQHLADGPAASFLGQPSLFGRDPNTFPAAAAPSVGPMVLNFGTPRCGPESERKAVRPVTRGNRATFIDEMLQGASG